jgi:hypothetical protein
MRSFRQTRWQVQNWLHERPHPRKRPSGRCDRTLTLEALEGRVLLTGTWTKLTNLAPESIGTMLLLSDGTVMAQGGGIANTWHKLTPTSSGSYVDGTWSDLASMHQTRLYYGSSVLTDGRVFVVGGEYSSAGSETNTSEIYNPITNTWTNTANFPEPDFGDDPTEVLPNGTVLGGYNQGPQTHIYDPSTNTWSPAVTKLMNDSTSEESWVKLPDDSILSYDICVFGPPGCTAGNAQRYVPSSNTWADSGMSPVQLTGSAFGWENGPAFLLPDGRAWFTGASGHTAFYDPASNSWTAGPNLPSIGGKQLSAYDEPGAVLTNGKVLLAVGTLPVYGTPTYLLEFDPATNTYTNVTPSSSIIDTTNVAYNDRMLVLPSGQVLLTTGTDSRLAVYTPDGTPDPSWAPTISSITDNGDGTYTLTGTQLNGINEGAAYGDDAQMASNYPIVQITDSSGNVSYARSYNWSSTSVATGSTPITTQFQPATPLAAGDTINVIANGIPSDPFTYNVSATQFVVVTDAADPDIAGTPFDVTVTAVDANGNVVPNYTGTVTFTSGDPYGATLPADYIFQASDQGQHTFSGVTLYTAGTWDVTATDTVNGITGSAFVNVQAAPAVTLAVIAPSTAVSGVPFDVTLIAQDPYGNTDTNYTGTVSWTASDPDPGVILPPDYMFQPSDQGQVTFSAGVTLITPGDQQLMAFDTSNNSINGSADVIVTTNSAPAHGRQAVSLGAPDQATASAASSAQTRTDVPPASKVSTQADAFFTDAGSDQEWTYVPHRVNVGFGSLLDANETLTLGALAADLALA